ncbi:MFS transporter [Thiotrichales bacterium 19S3-7]|nr:MFS transporter [Thiotrichales bacterium 19S3-7]MCF6801805.1 MFS transporter [Thiotrichales bacterium 19S3-11]
MWLSKLNKYQRILQFQRITWILIAGVLFYCYEFFLRILTGAYQEEITSYFHINSHLGFSFLISSYNFTYLLMQIPAGILLDKFGSRRCLAIATIICGLGSALFIFGGYYLALFSRLLVGLGSSFAFIGILKLSRECLPSRYFGLFASVVISLGTLAATLSQQISIFLSNYHILWQGVFVYAGLLSIPLACYFWLVIPKAKQGSHILPSIQVIKNATVILLKNKLLWLNALWAGCIYIPTVVITSQYGVYFFNEMFHQTQYQATGLISMLMLGWIIFSPIIVYFVAKTNRLNQIVSIFISMLVVNTLMLAFVSEFVMEHLTLLIFTFGLFSSVQAIVWQCFDGICDNSITGIGIAVTNMIITAVTEIGQLLSGAMLDISSSLRQSYHSSLFPYNTQVILLLFIVFIVVGWYVFYRFSKHIPLIN